MLTSLSIDQIDSRADARAIDMATVAGLVDSIGAVGLINPVRVRAAGDRWQLIAGAHRLQACKDLGLVEIEAAVVDDDDLHAELAMIDENLCRAELSPSDRARQTARRKELYEVLHPESVNGATGVGREKVRQVGEAIPADRFSSETATATGRSERTIQRDAERGEKVIDEALNLIRGTVLDKGAYLDKLKRLTPNDQITAVNRDLLIEKRRIREAKAGVKLAPDAISDFEAQEKQVARLMSAWNAASPEARKQFLDSIDVPIFDRSEAA